MLLTDSGRQVRYRNRAIIVCRERNIAGFEHHGCMISVSRPTARSSDARAISRSAWALVRAHACIRKCDLGVNQLRDRRRLPAVANFDFSEAFARLLDRLLGHLQVAPQRLVIAGMLDVRPARCRA